MDEKPKGKSNKAKIYALSAVLVVSVGFMVAFAIGIILEMRETGQGQAFYADIDVDFMPRSMPRVPSPVVVAATPAEITEEFVEEEFISFIDFDEMRERFPSIIGWIQSEGTVINYPIVQYTDNDFYLNHKPDRTRHRWGSIYLDYRNSPSFTDNSIIIYGHDMASGDKFGSLLNYQNQAYFEQHDTMFIFTPTGNYVLYLFAGYIINSIVEVPPLHFLDEEDFESYINSIRSRSTFTSDVEVNFGDRVVFLATCTRGGSVHDRFIVAGRLTPLY